MEIARNEALKWNLQERVKFRNYDGNPGSLEENEYDFIFTKSVLVIIPQLPVFLRELTRSIKIGGELIAAENMQTNAIVNQVISMFSGSNWRQKPRFKGVDRIFLCSLANVFDILETKEFYGLVAGIRAVRTK